MIAGDQPEPPRFAHFAAIDWSGAVGERHRGIAVALCDADGGPPRLLRPGHRWSRPEVLAWLREAMPAGTLVGLDLGMAMPFDDRGAYFPGWRASPRDARALWALVDGLCGADRHLAASALVDDPELSAYFRRHGGREGALFGLDGARGGRGRLRVTEAAQAAMGWNPSSNFNLVGAAQVGKASLTGMRVLNRLAGRVPIWPFDPLPPGGPPGGLPGGSGPGAGSVIVEIYTALAARAAGRRPRRAKMRTQADLDAALAMLGTGPATLTAPLTDHAADALVSAAWLRGASGRTMLWHPRGLTPEIARTEGWTFGTVAPTLAPELPGKTAMMDQTA